MYQKYDIFRILVAVAVLVSLTVGIVSAAPVTQSINYQGKLTDAAGNPLTGTYSVTFNLYQISWGGTALATDIHSVTATKGLFTTQITADPSFFDGRALWLGIKVGSDPEMTPRQELRPVPYALSLRPGAWITSSGGSSALNLLDNGGGNALNALTTGQWSNGVVASTSGSNSDGVRAHTSGPYSYGVYASTSGGPYSYGVYASTSGINSDGVLAFTSGTSSDGVYVSTSGTDSYGVRAYTLGQYSDGVYAYTTGYGSAAVAARAYGLYSQGVYAYSEQSRALEGDTNNANHEWGVYTEDYIYGGGIRAPDVDVAEYMPVTGDFSPGTVLVIGPEGKLKAAATAYDTRVAGIVSTQPAIALGTKPGGNTGEEIVAISGRVPCRADATYGAIRPGDLLSTSNTPGHAMKAEPTIINGRGFYPDGTILGKAMGTLESGTGTIEVLVTLQ